MPRFKTANSSPNPNSFLSNQSLLPWLLPLLWPLSLVWRFATWLRWQWVRPVKLSLPIIAVGNATVGGQGKTPTVLAIAERLLSQFRSEHIFCLSRGYGGQTIGPIEVIPSLHRAELVGDEPLLLSAQFRTIVARFRPAGAILAQQSGARIIVMDDGLQNPHIRPDLSILVVDGGSDSANLGVVPTGPFREPLAVALGRVQAVVLIGEDSGHWRDLIASLQPHLPVVAASLVPTLESFRLVTGQKIVAFAGIGRPEKFFDSLRRSGAELVDSYSFADHHPYRAIELERLRDRASTLDAALITTTKDYYRMESMMRHRITPFAVTLEFNDPLELNRLLKSCAKKALMNETD